MYFLMELKSEQNGNCLFSKISHGTGISNFFIINFFFANKIQLNSGINSRSIIADFWDKITCNTASPSIKALYFY